MEWTIRIHQSPILRLFLWIFLLTGYGCSDEKPENNETSFRHVPSTVSPEAQAFLRVARPGAITSRTVEEWQALREAANAGMLPESEQARMAFVSESEVLVVGGVSTLVVTPKEYESSHDGRITLYFHGGGYALTPPEVQYALIGPMARATGLRVYAPDYRLAPEHPYPAALEDCLAVMRALHERFGAENIFLWGDSAGGGLGLATVLRARVEGLPFPSAVGLISPMTDLTKTGDTYYTLEGISPVLHYEKNIRCLAEIYAADAVMTDPLLSPVYADYSQGFPPTIIQVGTRDLLLSNSVRLYRAMKRGGIDVEISMWEGMWHVFQSVTELPESKEAFKELAEFSKGHYGS